MSNVTAIKPVASKIARKPKAPVNTTEANVTRNKEVRAYLEERKALKEAVREGEKAAKRIKEMDASLIYPILAGETRYLIVNGQRVMARTENPVERAGVDLDTLRHSFPVAYEATYKPSIFHTLRQF